MPPNTGDLQIEISMGPEAHGLDVGLLEPPTVDLWPPGPIGVEVLTQAEYDQIASPTPNLLYVIIG